jgi:hypothetical protein
LCIHRTGKICERAKFFRRDGQNQPNEISFLDQHCRHHKIRISVMSSCRCLSKILLFAWHKLFAPEFLRQGLAVKGAHPRALREQGAQTVHCMTCQLVGMGPIALPNAFNWGNDRCEIDLTVNPHAPFQGVTWAYQRSRTAVIGMAWRLTFISRPADHCMVLALRDEIGFKHQIQ